MESTNKSPTDALFKRSRIGTQIGLGRFSKIRSKCTSARVVFVRQKTPRYIKQAYRQYIFNTEVRYEMPLITTTDNNSADTFWTGHSLTIIGFEKRKNGETNLLVFCPSSRDSSVIRDFVDREVRLSAAEADRALDPYRRGSKYLRKFGEFEVL
jgi:hypothetical protein